MARHTTRAPRPDVAALTERLVGVDFLLAEIEHAANESKPLFAPAKKQLAHVLRILSNDICDLVGAGARLPKTGARLLRKVELIRRRNEALAKTCKATRKRLAAMLRRIDRTPPTPATVARMHGDLDRVVGMFNDNFHSIREGN